MTLEEQIKISKSRSTQLGGFLEIGAAKTYQDNQKNIENAEANKTKAEIRMNGGALGRIQMSVALSAVAAAKINTTEPDESTKIKQMNLKNPQDVVIAQFGYNESLNARKNELENAFVAKAVGVLGIEGTGTKSIDEIKKVLNEKIQASDYEKIKALGAKMQIAAYKGEPLTDFEVSAEEPKKSEIIALAELMYGTNIGAGTVEMCSLSTLQNFETFVSAKEDADKQKGIVANLTEENKTLNNKAENQIYRMKNPNGDGSKMYLTEDEFVALATVDAAGKPIAPQKEDLYDKVDLKTVREEKIALNKEFPETDFEAIKKTNATNSAVVVSSASPVEAPVAKQPSVLGAVVSKKLSSLSDTVEAWGKKQLKKHLRSPKSWLIGMGVMVIGASTAPFLAAGVVSMVIAHYAYKQGLKIEKNMKNEQNNRRAIDAVVQNERNGIKAMIENSSESMNTALLTASISDPVGDKMLEHLFSCVKGGEVVVDEAMATTEDGDRALTGAKLSFQNRINAVNTINFKLPETKELAKFNENKEVNIERMISDLSNTNLNQENVTTKEQKQAYLDQVAFFCETPENEALFKEKLAELNKPDVKRTKIGTDRLNKNLEAINERMPNLDFKKVPMPIEKTVKTEGAGVVPTTTGVPLPTGAMYTDLEMEQIATDMEKQMEDSKIASTATAKVFMETTEKKGVVNSTIPSIEDLIGDSDAQFFGQWEPDYSDDEVSRSVGAKIVYNQEDLMKVEDIESQSSQDLLSIFEGSRTQADKGFVITVSELGEILSATKDEKNKTKIKTAFLQAKVNVEGLLKTTEVFKDLRENLDKLLGVEMNKDLSLDAKKDILQRGQMLMMVNKKMATAQVKNNKDEGKKKEQSLGREANPKSHGKTIS